MIFGENKEWENIYSESSHHPLYDGFQTISDQYWAVETRAISYHKKEIFKYERQKEDDSLGPKAVAVIDLQYQLIGLPGFAFESIVDYWRSELVSKDQIDKFTCYDEFCVGARTCDNY